MGKSSLGSVFTMYPLSLFEGGGLFNSLWVSITIGAYLPYVLCSVQPLPKGDQVLNFSDAEDLIDDSKLK